MKRLAVFITIATLFLVPYVHANDPSLRDKIGQMLIIGFDGQAINETSEIVKTLDQVSIGGVILFNYNAQTSAFDKNIDNPIQVKKLNADLQYYNQIANINNNRNQLPLLIAVDYEGGKVNRLKESNGFPATLSAAEVGKMTSIQANQIAANMAETLKETGFNLNFAPLLDVNVNPNNPIIGSVGRSFSDNPNDVTAYAAIFSQHFLNQGVQCAYKHFPGHGSATADSHFGFVDVTEHWTNSELIPYIELLNSGNSCGMIMTAHIINKNLDPSGMPATLSHTILTDLLREQLKFDGVIITDDMQMKAITDHYGLEQALTLAINAGADMFIFGNQVLTQQDPQALISIIETQVKTGQISRARIEEAYQRIIAFKQNLRPA